MPVVNPGIRRLLASAIQRLFNGASFSAPLTHSAIPTRAASGTTATFTRATTKTWPNNDGNQVTGVAGEIGFVGARRVRNLLTFTEDFSNAAWTKAGVTATAGQLTEDGTTGVHRTHQPLAGGATFAIGTRLLVQVELKQEGRRYVQLTVSNPPFGATSNAMFDLQSGVVSSTGAGSSATITATSGGYYRCTLLSNAATSAAVSSVFINPSNNGTNVSYTGTNGLVSISVRKAQVEDVTAQTTQTAGEYVSVGVPSDWAGTELVTNGTFDTDTTEWTTNDTGALSVDTSRLKVENLTVAAYASQGIATTVGTKYVLTLTGTSGVAFPWVAVGTTAYASDVLAATLASGFTKLEFTATSATSYIRLGTGGATVGWTAFFDNISVKVAYYHGSMVDGVKCFATDLSGNPIPSTTLLGYSAEGARTNLCLQSNAFTTTWTAYLTPSATQNVIGPDGATSAWTLTDNDAGDVEEIYQDITLTAAAYTLSIFVKKTVGATTFPALRWFIPGLTECAACTIDTNNGIATAWTAMTAFTMASGMSASCVSYNADFWRVSLTKTGTAAVHRVELFPAVTSNATQSTGAFSAAITGSSVFYGAQVNLGSFASSYIPTTTIAVARNADVLTYPSAGNVLGTAGWAYAEWTYPRAATTTTSPRIINTGAGSVPLYLASAIAGDLGLYDGAVRDGPTPAYPVTTPTKSASTWGGTAATITNAGVSVTTAFDGDMNVGSTIDIGCINGTGGFELNGTIRNVRIGQRQLSTSEHQAITA